MLNFSEVMKPVEFKHESFKNKSPEEIDEYYYKLAGQFTLFQQRTCKDNRSKNFYKAVGANIPWVIAEFAIGMILGYIIVFKFVFGLLKTFIQ